MMGLGITELLILAGLPFIVGLVIFIVYMTKKK